VDFYSNPSAQCKMILFKSHPGRYRLTGSVPGMQAIQKPPVLVQCHDIHVFSPPTALRCLHDCYSTLVRLDEIFKTPRWNSIVVTRASVFPANPRHILSDSISRTPQAHWVCNCWCLLWGYENMTVSRRWYSWPAASDGGGDGFGGAGDVARE
jgi:hypothetical protein